MLFAVSTRSFSSGPQPRCFPGALARIARHTGRVVMLTSPHQTPHPFFQQPNPIASMHKKMERLVRESGDLDIRATRDVCGERAVVVGGTHSRARRHPVAIRRCRYGTDR